MTKELWQLACGAMIAFERNPKTKKTLEQMEILSSKKGVKIAQLVDLQMICHRRYRRKLLFLVGEEQLRPSHRQCLLGNEDIEQPL